MYTHLRFFGGAGRFGVDVEPHVVQPARPRDLKLGHVIGPTDANREPGVPHGYAAGTTSIASRPGWAGADGSHLEGRTVGGLGNRGETKPMQEQTSGSLGNTPPVVRGYEDERRSVPGIISPRR
jgi:hypothetical protein